MKKGIITAILFIIAVCFGIWCNLPPRCCMSWFHELGHITVGGGEILDRFHTAVNYSNPIVWYAGAYGELLYLTLIVFILYKMGNGLLLSGFIMGACFIIAKDPFVLSDWEASSMAAKILFEVVFVAAIVFQIIIISMLAQKKINRQLLDRRNKPGLLSI